MLRSRLTALAAAGPLAACAYGAADFVLHFPPPLPALVEAASSHEGVSAALGQPVQRSLNWGGKTVKLWL